MLESLFATTATTSSLSLASMLASIAAALVLGLALAWVYTLRSRATRSFVLALAVLPAIVAVVIMMVNGNVGAGVAVAGAFSLVRFRSAPGSARDISFIFLAMAIGLVCGMGYVAYAAIVTAILGAVLAIYQVSGLGAKNDFQNRTLRITIPEDLDYVGLFTDIFANYTTYHELVSVKTTNMGSLFRLTYNVGIADPASEKAMIDEIRCRNGNLEVALSRQETASEGL